MPALPFDIDITMPCPHWTAAVADIESLTENAIAAAMAVLETAEHGEVSVALLDDKAMQQLNKDYRGKNKPTNVLSFPDAGPAPLLGDIVLAYETVAREAQAKPIPFEDHMVHLLIHGFLHLQGYDHEDAEDAEVMEALEIKALARLNIDNPYEIEEP